MAFLGWLVGAALFSLCGFGLHLLYKYVIKYEERDRAEKKFSRIWEAWDSTYDVRERIFNTNPLMKRAIENGEKIEFPSNVDYREDDR